jgi:cbb3-type cytochrome oxidase subunit 3
MGASNPGETRAIHNGFLTEATDWGVQGIALALMFLLAVWWVCWRGRRLALAAGDANAVLTFACIAGSLAAWATSSVFGDYLNDEWGFWTAALACAYLRVKILEPVPEELPAPRSFAVPASSFAQPARGSSVP